MARETSKKCFEEIKASGLLSAIRMKVLKGVLQIAPCTSTELHAHMMKYHSMNGSWRVLTYLRDMDVLYETGTRACKVTGRTVIEWDLTDRLPTKPTPKILYGVLPRMAKPRSINRSIDYILEWMAEKGYVRIDIEGLESLRKEKKDAKISPPTYDRPIDLDATMKGGVEDVRDSFMEPKSRKELEAEFRWKTKEELKAEEKEGECQ